ncbi:GNAT family N-acetyltransferase [Flavobacterium sp. RHBU_24]|uniref:GNAT family N-acetyltransferase n=1 Tax=Flavobacterium sp. RHBU_24 TaxID=3391185 RepID=UPI0039855C82
MIISNFKNNEAESQFEVEVDGALAFIEYYTKDSKLFLTHTEVPEALRGQGAAGSLVESTLKYARENGLAVVPLCSYVAYYVNNHPEWASVLSEGYQM